MIYFLLGFLLVGLAASLPTDAERQSPIVGGDDIDIKEVPYQIALFYRGKYMCGGTIVDKDIVVTAAHCIVLISAQQAKDFTIRAGSSLRSEGGITVQVADLISHAGFDLHTLDNDIAVMRLVQPLEYNDGVQPVKMAAEGEEIKHGEVSLVSGWGKTKESGDNSAILQGVKVAIINTEECAKAYKKNGFLITPRMLCAAAHSKDACGGDSGGPLVHNSKLAGVVSWGLGCARPEFPGVYAKVSALRSWIDENIARLRARQLLRGD